MGQMATRLIVSALGLRSLIATKRAGQASAICKVGTLILRVIIGGVTHIPDRTMTNPCRKRHSRLLAALLLTISAMSMGVSRAQDDVASMIARIESPQSPTEKDLDALPLQALMERLHVPGVSIAVVKDFKIHWAKAYGVADAETGRLLDTGTRFQAASISKPVTALAAMRLVQEHRLNLDADINIGRRTMPPPVSIGPTQWSRARFQH